jgi:TRAP-type C4-dicarboxylate transport system permease small subunit
MTRTELIIQLLKVAIGLAFGAYFVWWSLQVLALLWQIFRVHGIPESLFL